MSEEQRGRCGRSHCGKTATFCGGGHDGDGAGATNGVPGGEGAVLVYAELALLRAPRERVPREWRLRRVHCPSSAGRCAQGARLARRRAVRVLVGGPLQKPPLVLALAHTRTAIDENHLLHRAIGRVHGGVAELRLRGALRHPRLLQDRHAQDRLLACRLGTGQHFHRATAAGLLRRLAVSKAIGDLYAYGRLVRLRVELRARVYRQLQNGHRRQQLYKQGGRGRHPLGPPANIRGVL